MHASHRLAQLPLLTQHLCLAFVAVARLAMLAYAFFSPTAVVNSKDMKAGLRESAVVTVTLEQVAIASVKVRRCAGRCRLACSQTGPTCLDVCRRNACIHCSARHAECQHAAALLCADATHSMSWRHSTLRWAGIIADMVPTRCMLLRCRCTTWPTPAARRP
jgi:hypothetical protein